MTVNSVPTTGVEGFVAALNAFDAGAVVESGLVVCTVVPVSGALAGKAVRTGVLLDEVAPWPTTPPHWIHLPEDIAFATTNISGSPKQGWRSHSREITGWGTAPSLGAAWLAHVRGFPGGAQ